MGLKTSGDTMQSPNNSSRRCAHVSAIFSPPGFALPKWGAGKEAIVFTTCYVMQWGAKVRHTVGLHQYKETEGRSRKTPGQPPTSVETSSLAFSLLCLSSCCP